MKTWVEKRSLKVNFFDGHQDLKFCGHEEEAYPRIREPRGPSLACTRSPRRPRARSLHARGPGAPVFWGIFCQFSIDLCYCSFQRLPAGTCTELPRGGGGGSAALPNGGVKTLPKGGVKTGVDFEVDFFIGQSDRKNTVFLGAYFFPPQFSPGRRPPFFTSPISFFTSRTFFHLSFHLAGSIFRPGRARLG